MALTLPNASRLALQRRPRFAPNPAFRPMSATAAPAQFSSAGPAPRPVTAPRAPAAAPTGDNPLGLGSGGNNIKQAISAVSSGQTPLDRQTNQIVQGGIGSGVFNPNYLSGRVQAGAQRRGDALRRRSDVFSQLLGLDPGQQRVAMVGAENGINQQMADYLGDASLKDASDYRDVILQLLGGSLDRETRKYEARQQAKAGRSASLGGTLGSIGSAVIGRVGL